MGIINFTRKDLTNKIYKKIKLDIEENDYNKYVNFVEATFNIEQYFKISDIFTKIK